ncbi:ABC transporter ATP-binding protein [Mechercharimyces sp. CAU 1602]|uniref:ABC transporter ATP-binding protein n=1 Tax=Mechercharimyces sp. CAU 1602 TaxID=2973933 RepID=UPI0021612EBB|nr:ABC transporter ATP-binding protein [Mechercharimyces sp. CAU 1602]MCS1352060.1 ABC transporter ATP-binding protein [Mechercharimyces sp. CAU 1602]
MIEIRNVSKTYRGSKHRSVDSLSLTIQPGEIFGFLGPNGAGKTTTIRMMTGILTPDEGDIQIAGYSIRKNAVEAKRYIGYVPDSPEPYDRLTGMEYINFIADIYHVTVEERKQRLPQLLQKFRMEDAVHHFIHSYSRGMKQKVTLIATLLHQPQLWILDEPMVGLDPQAALTLKEMMRQYRALQHSVFISTHVLEVAEKLCDRIGIIDKGRLIAVGTLNELQQGQGNMIEDHATLEQLFIQLTNDDSIAG